MRRFALIATLLIVAGGLVACRDERAGGGSSGGDTTTTAKSVDSGGAQTFGDLASPCGPGNAKGATDKGVTDDAIHVGTMSDATATAQPGLNQELWDGSTAFVDWCNAQGGINGRKIDDTHYEPKLFDAKQATIQACDDGAFMLVGGGAAFDNDVAQQRVACGLPEVPAFNATKPATEASLTYPPLATRFDKLPVGEAFYLAKQHPDAVAKAGILTANFPAAVNIATRAKVAYTNAGWKFVDTQLYNPAGEANWTGIVAGLRAKGVDALLYSGTFEPLAAFVQAAREQNWKPTILIGTSTIFTPDFVTEAGGAAEGALSYTNITPFDDAKPGSATAKYADLLEKYVPNAKPTQLGADSLSAWLLWATAAKECGSGLTRDCIAKKIGAITKWTAGGLNAPSDPSAGTAPPCFVLVQVKDGKWTRVHPASGFDCKDSYVVPTPANYS